MISWFNFAGVSSAAMGVIVEEHPPITMPEERVAFKPALGKSGSYTILDGDDVYEDIVLPVKCFLTNAAYIDQVGAWLRGRGALILGNMASRYYDARCINQMELQQVLKGNPHRRFTAVFRAKPYRYHYPVVAPFAVTNGATVTNPGNIDAEPLITVAGSGDIDLHLGTKVIEITGLFGSISIDAAFGVAYQTNDPSVSLTGILSQDEANWPYTIPPGEITVSWTGTVSALTIKPNWRDL